MLSWQFKSPLEMFQKKFETSSRHAPRSRDVGSNPSSTVVCSLRRSLRWLKQPTSSDGVEHIKDISPFEATSAHRDLLRLDLEFFPFYPFAGRIWGLRHNLTSYDASCVAIAEALGCPLATLDLKLS